MRRFTKLFACALTLGVLLMGTAAFACGKHKPCKCKAPCDKKEHAAVEAYAHPTLFGDEQQVYIDGSGTKYIMGGKIYKVKNKYGIKNKDNVYVNTFSKGLLDAMREKQFGLGDKSMFDVKKPILRAELAFVLAEGLNVQAKPTGKKYHDVPSTYWAAAQVARAYDAGLMIGYPDDNFRPDQEITKAEVFAVIAQMIDVPIDRSLLVVYKGKDVKYVPDWAISASKETIASKLLDKLPDQSKIVEDKYLSKEQVAYLIGELRNDFYFYKKLGKDPNAPDCIKNYQGNILDIKLLDRVSARVSNVGDIFTAKTLKEVTVDGKTFPAGSIVKAKVVGVQRPGIEKTGYVKVKFVEIVNGKEQAEFPAKMSEAQADVLKNPNVIARILGFPFSTSARIVGVAGRTAGGYVNVAANGVEALGDDLSNAFVETATLHPGSGAKSAGHMFITTGKGIYDILKLTVSGPFGIIYEITDEIKYVILPSASNDSSLNPNEELTVLF